jgi:hypothetical protein
MRTKVNIEGHSQFIFGEERATTLWLSYTIRRT